MRPDLVQRLTIEPAPQSWRELAMRHFESLDDQAIKMRRELGLPVDRPLVMTGHQATFWHPGVLAKYLAAQALGASHDLGVAWLVADQDIHEHGPLLAPVSSPRGRLEALGTILMGCAGSQVATASCPAFEPQEPALGDLEYALPSVQRGMRAILAALRAHQDQPSAADQIARATQDLIAPHLERHPTVFATRLSQTSLFRSILDRLRSDSAPAIDTYNEAALEFPDSGITPMATDDQGMGVELPLWTLARGAARRRVYLDDLTNQDLEFAPRAILMSGLIRLGACDLFIVGTGGELYDRVTERWFDRWLGQTLAPRVMVTADVLLPLHDSEIGPRDVARAVWRAHSAPHNPSALGLMPEHAQKRRLVGAIEEARARGDDPLPHFRALHDWLDQYRAGHADELLALRDEAIEAAQRLGERAIAQNRTWAFPLHEPDSIDALKQCIEARFARAPSPCGAE